MTLETPGESRAFDALARAGQAKAAMDLLGDELLTKIRAVDLRAFNRLLKGEHVSADEALHLLYEKFALWKLIASLEQALTAGKGPPEYWPQGWRDDPMSKETDATVHPDASAFALDPAKSGQTPPVDDSEPAEKPKPRPQPQGPSPAEQALAQTNAELLATVATLARPPAQQQQQEQAPEVTLDLDGLPDPEQDKAGFLKGLGERLGTTIGQVSARATERATRAAAGMVNQQQTLDSTWSRFRDEHADIAQHSEVVEAAAKRVANGLRARGLDPEAYLTTNQDQFLDALAEETTKTLNRIRGLNEDGTDPAANEDEGRDNVIPDRATGTGRGRKGAPEKPSLFTDEIKQAQKALKLF